MARHRRRASIMSAGMDKSPENNPVDGQNAHGCHTLTIWADADSLPKDIRPFLIKRAWTRRDYEDIRVLVQFVAARAPADIPREFLVLVEPGEGAADRYIEAHAAPYDIVVTRDIPFAERLVGRSVHAMNDRGDTFTTENIAERRSLRDAMVSLRSAGLAPPSPKNSQRTQTETKHFADALERLVVRAVRGKKRNDQD